MTNADYEAGVSESEADKSGDEHSRWYRIGELSDEFGVTLRTLRFYEDKGLLAPERQGNTRLYSRQDRGRLKLILQGKRLGFPLSDIKEVMDLYKPKGSNSAQLQLALKKGEKQMRVLEKQRQTVDEAISELKDTLDEIRKRLGSSR